MNLRRFLRKCASFPYLINGAAFTSFSQAGEDMVVNFLFNDIGNTNPTYLDVGANDPIIGNNTYFLYQRGSKGVCVEPDPYHCSRIRKKRPGSVLLEAGISFNNEMEGTLHIFPHPYTGWNTFSAEEAEIRVRESGVAVAQKKKVPLVSINDVCKNHLNGAPDFLSIDVEGLDLPILQSINYELFAPKVICAETVEFSTGHNRKKKHQH